MQISATSLENKNLHLSRVHECRKRLNRCVREIVVSDEIVGRFYGDYSYM